MDNTIMEQFHDKEKGDDLQGTDSDDTGTPTKEEKQTLRKVPDKLPWSAFLVALVELCERFAYYGLSGPFQVRAQSSTVWSRTINL